MTEQAGRGVSVRAELAERQLLLTYLPQLQAVASDFNTLLDELARALRQSPRPMSAPSDATEADWEPLAPSDLDRLSFDLVVTWQVHHRRHRRKAGQAELCAVLDTSRSTLHRRLVKAGIDWEEATQQAMHTAERLLIESDMAPRPHAELTAAPPPPSATGRLAIHPAVEP